ncbi:unnamed protein product [Echinostoma caproni]|uniref:Uncharacterized protein n=1 Tax=Echinostoma caproni TaxID=27848 RepID=A0A183AY15_9TREM|nr:unnamed protein product [Echinostoma caproni]
MTAEQLIRERKFGRKLTLPEGFPYYFIKYCCVHHRCCATATRLQNIDRPAFVGIRAVGRECRVMERCLVHNHDFRVGQLGLYISNRRLSEELEEEVCGFVRTKPTPALPQPSKFSIGDNFRRWAGDAQDYVTLFPPNERRIVLLSLLDGQAKDMVRVEGILDGGITADTFIQLRRCLCNEELPIEHLQRFQARRQLPGEQWPSFILELRHLAEDAFPELPVADREDKVIDQLCIGTTDSFLQRKFLKQRPTSVAEAMETARRESQIEAMVRRNEQEVLGTIAPIQAPNAGPRRPPYFPNRMSYTPQHRRPPRFEQNTSVADCGYCRRFGTKAQACGHNKPSESSAIRSIPICFMKIILSLLLLHWL